MPITTYGIKVNLDDVKKAATETKDLRPYHGEELQIDYDKADGSIYTNLHNDGWYTHFHSKEVINVARADAPMGQQEIVDAIREALEEERMNARIDREGAKILAAEKKALDRT